MSSKVAGKKRAASPDLDEEEHIDIDNGNDELVEEGDNAESGPSTLTSTSTASKPKTKAKGMSNSTKTSKKRKTLVPGIVYISRLPPGMTPQKVKYLMAQWGDVGKIYAQKKDAPTGYNPNTNASKKKKEKHAAANYSEAWVEFLDKNVAKTVASMMNAQVIGGKKGDKWRDDVWTMKYLSGFKWEMLGEQVAYERQAHQARLRNEITQSRAEQGEYLRNVELARVLDKRKARKDAEGTADSVTGTGKKEEKSGEKEKEKQPSRYRQREVADRSKGMEKKGMDSVLGSVFG